MVIFGIFKLMIIAEDGRGTEIKGILAFVSSASIDDPDLVIARSVLKKFN